MGKFLVRATYSAEGVRGLLKDGGTGRRDAVAALVESLGGTLESFYFAFGDRDVYAVIDADDKVTVAAASLAVSASGATRSEVVVLLTPDEVDEATRKTVAYRAPGA